jgi:eukaryotic-like serine/threonine-protein kinase
MDESTSGGESAKVTVVEQRIGSYRVLNSLGSGGMSTVFRAVHVDSGHEVALKVLTRTLARNSTLLQRFLREARSAEALQHPNIVTIYDRGIDRGRHYLVLEYVPGGDFHEYIQRRGPLSTVEAVSVVKSVAAGLEYAASLGLIHRDIKPSNILRTPAGQVKIIDLGLALQNAFEDERVTREGTTVGTVDYMAPEQARDSRATSIQSDTYSLGCTFYYLLTGVAAYPGGDITDKLTRHAKSPVPDVRDLRLDVPPMIAAIIQRMMAKRPEERFTSYDELIAALDAAPLDGLDQAPDISVIPLADELEAPPSHPAVDPWPSRASGEYSTNGTDSGRLEVAALAELAYDGPHEIRERPTARTLGPEPIMRRSTLEVEEPATDLAAESELPAIAPSKGASSAPVWIISAGFVGLAVILLTVGLLQFLDSTPAPAENAIVAAEADVVSDRPIVASPRQGLAAAARTNRLSNRESPRLPVASKPAAPLAEPKWLEPADSDPAEIDAGTAPDAIGSRVLPEWARSPVPDKIDVPFVVVKRVADTSDPATVPTLHAALDSFIGGTIELADEGPLFNDDLRVAGETRLIRARRGYRPIVRVERSNLDAVRKQSAVFVLDRKNLTLDGIDLIVDVRDLSPEQVALFSCSGANLTLRNCSITILNYNNTRFSVVKVEANSARPTRIRLERTLVRGRFGAGVDLGGGSTGLVLHKSVLLGGPGPLVRVGDSEATADRRLFVVESILAGPGPIFEWSRRESGPPARQLSIRAFGSVFGRLKGVGVATVISSSSSADLASKQIEWEGDNNLFAGWKGFFASGNDPTVTIPDLAAVRSTWNRAERDSREILAPWPDTADPAAIVPADLSPFVPDREMILRQVAQPRAGLFEKALGEYASPAIPEPAGWALERPAQSQRGAVRANPVAARPVTEGKATPAKKSALSTPRFGPSAPDTLDLSFDTQAPPWNGDLGAFLRDRLTSGLKHARVLVVGSGTHHFTPVRLPDGLYLEIRVEALAASDALSWSPEPGATGLALIELRGGALVMSNVMLRHQEAPQLQHLIHVEDGHLVLSRCQLTATGAAGDDAGNLIAFRSPSTQPYPANASLSLFSSYVDRPICRLDESILITGGIALKAELGKGLVALTQCAIAAGITGVALLPSKVSRRRFEADLVMDHCTLTAERSIIRVGPWNGLPPGPDRPWLITSRSCAFLAMYDRRTRETVLLRGDSDALARGTVSWQATDDAVDVDFFTAAGDGPPAPGRPRDVQVQWIHFWGYNHIHGRLTGPRGAGSPPSVRFWDRLHPGRIEPVDLLLNPDYHPDRDRLNVGADLGRLGITPRVTRYGRPH